MRNLALNPTIQVNFWEKITSTEGVSFICEFSNRVAENKIDLKKPSAFQIRKGNDVKKGMLKIIKNPKTRSLACLLLAPFFQRYMRYKGSRNIAICLIAKEILNISKESFVFSFKRTKENSKKKIAANSRWWIRTIYIGLVFDFWKSDLLLERHKIKGSVLDKPLKYPL